MCVCLLIIVVFYIKKIVCDRTTPRNQRSPLSFTSITLKLSRVYQPINVLFEKLVVSEEEAEETLQKNIFLTFSSYHPFHTII